MQWGSCTTNGPFDFMDGMQLRCIPYQPSTERLDSAISVGLLIQTAVDSLARILLVVPTRVDPLTPGIDSPQFKDDSDNGDPSLQNLREWGPKNTVEKSANPDIAVSRSEGSNTEMATALK